MHVTAAGAYEHVLNELIPVFFREFGISIRLTVANAAGVIKRLEAGEAVDVVLTSAAGIDHLVASGLADRASSVEIGRMRLGVAVAPGQPLPDLSTAEFIAVGFARRAARRIHRPQGRRHVRTFHRKAFRAPRVASQMEHSGVLSKTGKDVVRAVASGEATCGLTQASELIGAKGVRFAGTIPAELQVISVYAGAVTTQARAPDLAMDFIRFLKSPESAVCFRSSGWDAGGGNE